MFWPWELHSAVYGPSRRRDVAIWQITVTLLVTVVLCLIWGI